MSNFNNSSSHSQPGAQTLDVDPAALADVISLFTQTDSHKLWSHVDRIYSDARRFLDRYPQVWRCGPERVLLVAQDAFNAFSSHGPITDKIYLDLGCGRFHPYGTGMYLYLNGAKETFAIDDDQADIRRAAEAMYDLLCDALVRPEVWRKNQSISYEEYLGRIRRFDIQALRQGDIEKGLNGLPLHYQVGAAESTGRYPSASLDLVSSRSVLEHCMDLKGVLAEQYNAMSPGGLAYHTVDLVDHRFYQDSSVYHYWYFLTSDDTAGGDSQTNQLRSSEVLAIMGEVGFEIVNTKPVREPLPGHVHDRLTPKYRELSQEELETIGLEVLLKKPD